MLKKKCKCHFCAECRGTGCMGELPGLGGFGGNINFKLNCAAWDVLFKKHSYLADSGFMPKVRYAPVTGAVENIGWEDEESFYYAMISACYSAGIDFSIGDGCPDIKLKTGIDAVSKTGKKAAVFIKPYKNDTIFERMEWAGSVADIFGIDIDSYNILTMRNKVHLEKKTADQLLNIKKHAKKAFAIKGIFTVEDVELVKKVKPDIVYISNHGGRVENRIGSTADFLLEYHKVLKNYCSKLWIDGGIRKKRDILIAGSLGIDEVLLGRPLISALCEKGQKGVVDFVKKMSYE